MTISTTATQAIFGGNDASVAFSFSFIGVAPSDLELTYTDLNGNQSIISPNLYSIAITPPASNSFWGIGGILTYPLSGPAIVLGTYLTLSRKLALTQQTTINNQNNMWPQVIETALDTLCLEIQQISSKTGQISNTNIR